MTHPLVRQLRFTRSEFRRSVAGVSDADGSHRFPPLNAIGWNIGHLAWQEQAYFLTYGQGQKPLPEIEQRFASGAEGSAPPLSEMLAAWMQITATADPWLDALTRDVLQSRFTKRDGSPGRRTFGSLLQRVIYHYWYHTGENMAIRQLLGHRRLPQFVGNVDDHAPWEPEEPD